MYFAPSPLQTVICMARETSSQVPQLTSPSHYSLAVGLHSSPAHPPTPLPPPPPITTRQSDRSTIAPGHHPVVAITRTRPQHCTIADIKTVLWIHLRAFLGVSGYISFPSFMYM